MKADRWHRIESLYEAALKLDSIERASFLAESCAGDEELRCEIESLIRSHEQAGNFIESPALDVAAELYGNARQRLAIDQRIGRYRIIGLLGAGGMGEVYRAEDTQLERHVAIKILPPDLAGDPSALARFKREAKAVAALSHPNILALHDFGFDQGLHYAVMELLDGETLATTLTRGPLDWRRAVEIAIAVAEGLVAAHAKGTIHRDIKPDNIFITVDNQVKILDFGIASVRRNSSEMHRTTPGLVMGSPLYASPEQLRAEPVDAPSDIFALGNVLYEMITGHRTFERATVAETIATVLNGSPPAMAESVAGIPAELEQLVQHCLQPKAADRFQSPSELALACKAVLNGRGKRTRVRAASWISILVLIVAGLFLRNQFQPSPAATAAPDSLAILPLSNDSGDPELDYVSDGITEALINNLSQLSKLRVIARTTAFRYKGRTQDPQQVGKQLGVRRVLTGRLTRQAGSLGVQIDMVNVVDGLQLWGERYNEQLSNLLVLPEKISGRISEKLQLKLTGAETTGLARRHTGSTEAYRLYLLGRFYWNKRTEPAIRKSIEYFQLAIEQDPAYALAYAGQADSYAVLPSYSSAPSREALLKSKASALKALEIDETLAEAHATLASISDAEWNWVEAEKRFKRALELNPGYATAHQWYSSYLAEIGRIDDAVQESRRAYELDPLSLSINLGLGANLYIHQDYDRAIEQFRQTLELDSNFVSARIHLALALLEQNKLEAAAGELEQARTFTHGAPPVIALLGYVHARSGKRREALEILRGFTSARPPRAAAYDLAVLHFGLGDIDRAFEYLNKAIDERHPLVPLIHVEPFWKPLRSDPRFNDLLRRMQLAS